MTNLQTSLDFYTDAEYRALGVAKNTSATTDVVSFNRLVSIGLNGTTGTLVSTSDQVDAKAGGVYTVYAAGVNQFAFPSLKPTVIVCDDVNDTSAVGSLLSSSCVYGLMK